MAGDEVRNTSHQEGQVDNQGAVYQGVGQVINGPITQQTATQTNVTRYSVEPEESPFVEIVSKLLHRHVGDQKATVFAWASIAGGLLSLVPQVLQRPAALVDFAGALVGVGILLMAVGISVRSALSFKAARTCPECDEHYGLEEVRDAMVEDVVVHEGVRRTTTRFFGCRSCDFTEDRTTRKLVED